MASNLLWAHLLRKNATTTTGNDAEPPSQIPPIAPQDRTATSMRMLIHDTQVNLEKFSTRLDGLFQRVDDCRSQVVNANNLLDVERDKVLAEMCEMVNRCQTEIKTHVGAPAQAHALDFVRVSQVSTERSVLALEKRIDALQALVQTHAHAVQAILDKQNALVGAYMDQIKATLSDMVARSIEGVRSTLVSEFAHGRGCGRSSTVVASATSTSRSRRQRDGSLRSPREVNVLPSSPLDDCGRGPHLSLKRPRIEEPFHAGEDGLPRKLPRLGLPRTPGTPRQPLADLLLPPDGNTPRVQRHCVPETLAAPSTPSIVQASLQPNLNLEDPTITQRCSLAVNPSAAGLPHSIGPSDPDALSNVVEIKDIPKLTDVISIHSTPLSSLPLSLPLATHYDRNETGSNMATESRDAPQVGLVHVPPPSSNPASSNASPPKSMSLRDRRAQISRFGRAETRRFIPLVPWSDEEE